MIKNFSLKNQLLISVILLIALSMSILYYFTYESLKTKIDISQKELYSKKIDNIIYFINEKNEKLKKTGMISNYEESFKKGTIKSIKEIFIQNIKQETIFIINDENTMILHPKFNKNNKILYKDDKSFLKIISQKAGDFDFYEHKKDMWVIFKYYEPWDWIIGYNIHKDLKYKELNEFSTSFFLSVLIFILLVSFILMFIIKKVLAPIEELTKASKEIALGNLNTKIEVFGAWELKNLAQNYKIMRDKISEDFIKIKAADKKLKNFNQKLQLEVEERTRELQESNDELETSIENLRITQNKLIESEKLAGLGNLVASVAHEINTPVGISLTGSSHLEYLNEEINEKYKEKKLSEEELKNFLEASNDLAKVINTNLNRTAEIIKNFKQVAVDQTSEQQRFFNVKEYLKGLLISIDSLFNKKDIKIEIKCNDDLEVNSYPGFIAQIITNLVSNSVIHGFKDLNSGKISIKVKGNEDKLIFTYKDTGKGISENNLLKIYEPFFSTNKKQGGTGLGLNIVYNLVTNNLKGTIDCKSEENKGTTFIIKIPIK